MTWSVFGPLADAEPALRASFLGWICGQAGLPGEDCGRTVDLWRRIAHPQKPAASNGPELDAVLEGDRTVVFVECKWGSPEGRGQGPLGDRHSDGLAA